MCAILSKYLLLFASMGVGEERECKDNASHNLVHYHSDVV